MLARIAESCYWIGRLVERADYTARLLDVHYHNLLQHHVDESSSFANHLVSVMGPGETRYFDDIETAVNYIGFDNSFSGSISDTIFQLSENAKGVRDTIPAELFEAIYSTSLELSNIQSGMIVKSRHETFKWVRNRCMLIHGIIDEAMARDDSYNYLNIGRSLERIDMTARMVAVRCATNDDAPAWITMLRSCGAFEAYVRAKGDPSNTYAITEFLLRDPHFPRSILSSASSALASAQQLVHDSSTVESEQDPRFALGRMCAEIEFASIEQIHNNLIEEVFNLQSGVRAVNETMVKTYFHHTNAIEWRQ
ncbi:MAG: alpha-E domain-containing protein [Acidimicrobiia bacterium]